MRRAAPPGTGPGPPAPAAEIGPPRRRCTRRSGGRVAGRPVHPKAPPAAWAWGITPAVAGASFIADPDNTRHFAGDGNSNKPIDSVSGLFKRGLEGKPVRNFTPPTTATAQNGAR